jgi:hypothetical protein
VVGNRDVPDAGVDTDSLAAHDGLGRLGQLDQQLDLNGTQSLRNA